MAMQATIEQKLREALTIEHLEIHNESHMHRGPATDSHFKLVVVAPNFEGLGRVKRHQRIYAILADELAMEGGIHALVMHLHTAAEWQQQGQVVPPSARCSSQSAP